MKLPFCRSEMAKCQKFHAVHCNVRWLDLESTALSQWLICSPSNLDLGHFFLEQQPLPTMNLSLKSLCLQTFLGLTAWPGAWTLPGHLANGFISASSSLWTWRTIRMSASLNFVPRSPCLPHPSSTPTWHHTWSSTRSCLNSAIKIQLKCSHSQVDIFHPIHITPFAAFDTTTLYPSPKLFPFINYHEVAALVLCTPVLLKPSSGHSPLRAPQGLVSYLLIFNSLRAVSFQNGSDHQLCSDGSLSSPSSSDFTLYCHLNWVTDSTVPPPLVFFFLNWWHRTVT